MDCLELNSDKNKKKLSFKLIQTLLILFSIFAALNLEAQLKSDIGIMSGISYYMGDINPSKLFYKPQLAYTAFYRYNFNKRYSLRNSLTYAGLKAADSDFPDNIFQTTRNKSFSSKLLDFSVQFEFNYWPYKTSLINKDNLSPYIFSGITGFYTFSPSKGFFLGIPFGAGFKMNINKRIGIGVEYSFRKTFTDAIDGSSSWHKEDNFEYTNDWYSFAGIFATYKIYTNEIICPAYSY